MKGQHHFTIANTFRFLVIVLAAVTLAPALAYVFELSSR